MEQLFRFHWKGQLIKKRGLVETQGGSQRLDGCGEGLSKDRGQDLFGSRGADEIDALGKSELVQGMQSDHMVQMEVTDKQVNRFGGGDMPADFMETVPGVQDEVSFSVSIRILMVIPVLVSNQPLVPKKTTRILSSRSQYFSKIYQRTTKNE